MAYKKIKIGKYVGEEKRRLQRNRVHRLENNYDDECGEIHPEDLALKPKGRKIGSTLTVFEDPFVVKKDYGRSIVKELREFSKVAIDTLDSITIPTSKKKKTTKK